MGYRFASKADCDLKMLGSRLAFQGDGALVYRHTNAEYLAYAKPLRMLGKKNWSTILDTHYIY